MLEPLKERVLQALKDIEDPEVGTNIVDLGLIYEVTISEPATARIQMTTTTRFCPVSGMIAEAVRARVETIEGIDRAEVELVYDPPWSPDMVNMFSSAPLGTGAGHR